MLVRLRGEGRWYLAGVSLVLAAEPAQTLVDSGRLGSAQSAVNESVKVKTPVSWPEGVISGTAPIIDELVRCRALQTHGPFDLCEGIQLNVPAIWACAASSPVIPSGGFCGAR